MTRPDAARCPWFVGAAFALTLLCAAASADAAAPFVFQVVDAAGFAGRYASLKLDSRGDPHISYQDASQSVLRYAHREHGVWTIETVDASARVGAYSSLAIDATGQPVIAYYDQTNSDLKLARKSGGVWTIQVVDAVGSVGTNCSLILDQQSSPLISYYDATYKRLRYARPGARELLAEGGAGTALILDAQGLPLIAAYLTVSNPTLSVVDKYGAAGNWRPVVVDPFAGAARGVSIARDSSGVVHVCGYDSGSRRLRYSRRTAGFATVETADSIGTAGPWCSIQADRQGVPHISYYNENRGDLMFASRTGGVWTRQVVDTAGMVGSYTSLALDAEDNPAIAYCDETNGDLRYAESAVRLLAPVGGEQWTAGGAATVRWSGIGPVDIELSTDGGSGYVTLASGVSENEVQVEVPELATRDARIRIRRAAPRSTSVSAAAFAIVPPASWWSKGVDDAGYAGAWASLAVRRDGTPMIAWCDGTAGRLRLATRTGRGWAQETVDAASGAEVYASLALDAGDDPHISYHDAVAYDLKYAQRLHGRWSIETVDADGVVGTYTSLALDGAGNPHISYHDATRFDLKYAHRSDGIWHIETVDATGLVGMYSSIALNAAGVPTIAYYDVGVGALKVATRNAGGWFAEVVDPGPNVGQYASLCFDAAGVPGVAYFDDADSDLRFAEKAGGRWRLETVDREGDVGLRPTLATDREGRPCISYLDRTRQRLKLATRIDGAWSDEAIEASKGIAMPASLAIDAQGNPRFAFLAASGAGLHYVSGAIELEEPFAGAVWPAGSRRTVRWNGLGKVDVSISADDGRNWTPLAHGVSGGEATIDVPRMPFGFARIRLDRSLPRSTSWSEGLVRISTTVQLLALTAVRAPEGGTRVSWSSDPGPADLAGYRLERADETGTSWETVMPLARATDVLDPRGADGHRYRLIAVDGLGQETTLGETRLPLARPLDAWPRPWRGGALHVSFLAPSGGAPVTLELLDVAGRRVATLASGTFAAGEHRLTWDGRDAEGQTLPAGIYVVRLRAGGTDARFKLVVTP